MVIMDTAKNGNTTINRNNPFSGKILNYKLFALRGSHPVAVAPPKRYLLNWYYVIIVINTGTVWGNRLGPLLILPAS